ncbi:hypothetical protein H0H93_007263 [Arthromyces matolae]|nr:hypothetical protein H0H93_007263 [Arthromyces matolae]
MPGCQRLTPFDSRTMPTRTGRHFRAFADHTPYQLRDFHLPTLQQGAPIRLTNDFDQLIQSAVLLQDEAHDDAEGMTLSFEESVDTSAERAVSPPRSSPAPSRHAGDMGIDKRRRKDYHARRQKERRVKQATIEHYGRRTRTTPDVKARLFKQPIRVQLDAAELPHGPGAWIGKRGGQEAELSSEAQNLIDLGFQCVCWDGRTPCSILDKLDRGIAFLAGRPQTPDWDRVVSGMAATMTNARLEAEGSGCVDPKDLRSRRGEFMAVPAGVSFGGGSQKPGNLNHSAWQRKVLNSVMKDKDVQRVAGFQSSCFASSAPKLYEFYCQELSKLFAKHPHLRHTFKNSVFPACTFNCGPTTCTQRHVDFNNLPFGLCAITALGDFNPKQGGHLILYGLKLIIEFPPGSTVLIPSGAIEHGNVPIALGESRLSFTQYAAGGLFRWVTYGFKTIGDAVGKKRGRAAKEGRLTYDLAEGVRWNDGISLFSTPASIDADRRSVFSKSTVA